MYDFEIKCDNGSVTVIRARTRSSAIKMYLVAEGCSEEWFCEHCRVKTIFDTNENLN
jgi:hypothetical protein